MSPNNIAGNLRRIRLRQNLSQTELAELAGCQRAAVSNIENQARLGSLALLCDLAEALGVTVDNLLASTRKRETR